MGFLLFTKSDKLYTKAIVDLQMASPSFERKLPTMNKQLLFTALLSCLFLSTKSLATTYVITHSMNQGTITYVAGDVIEFYTSIPGEYNVNTSAGSVIGFTSFSNYNELAATYVLTGTETMASITLRTPTFLPPPSQPYTFSPTIVNLAVGCNVTIPDANFKNYLVNNAQINLNSDTEIQCSEATAFTGAIDCSSLNITDLTGIEAFTNLTWLNCYSNQLTQLDLSNNLALYYLICSSNQLTSLNLGSNTLYTTIACGSNQITSLDISNCDGLNALVCEGNQISSLDLSGKTALTNLQCGTNNMSSLDVSDCIGLVTLTCYENNLIALDVSQNTLLNDLRCATNPINGLDVSMLTNLSYLYCGDNGLTNLDVSNNTDLLRLDVSYNPMTTIDLSANTNLISFGAVHSSILDLDLTQNTALQEVSIHHGLYESVNIQNGNNQAITYVAFMNNPNLSCVQVDDVAYSVLNWSSQSDVTTTFSLNCAITNAIDEVSTETMNVYPNPTKGTSTIVVAKPTQIRVTTLDGTELLTSIVEKEKVIDLSAFSAGFYFIHSTEGQTIKLIKE